MITDYLIVIGAILGFSIAASITKNGFSTNVFLTGVAICISVLIWVPMLPRYLIIVPILIITGIFFSGSNTEGAIANE